MAEETDGFRVTDHNLAAESIDGGNHTENNHDRWKTERDGAQGAMPGDTASRDETSLHHEENHPEGKNRSMEMKDGTGQRGAQHAGAEVGWRKTYEDHHAQQDRHATKEEALDGCG